MKSVETNGVPGPQGNGELMENNATDPIDSVREETGSGEGEGKNKLVRLLKEIDILSAAPGPIDETIVTPRLYNSFNFAMLGRARPDLRMAIGVISANPGEGKTLVASNLAVSLASTYEEDTVLVDANILTPAVHRVFGVPRHPGLIESLRSSSVSVHQSRIPHLYLLSAGDLRGNPYFASKSEDRRTPRPGGSPSFGPESISDLNDVLYSLRERFRFVILDMPTLNDLGLPLRSNHSLDGLLVVVDASRTRREQVEQMFRRVNESLVLGFVFNRAGKDLVGS